MQGQQQHNDGPKVLYSEWGLVLLHRPGAQTVSGRTHIWVDPYAHASYTTYGYSDRRISDVLKFYHRGLSLRDALDAEFKQFRIKRMVQHDCYNQKA